MNALSLILFLSFFNINTGSNDQIKVDEPPHVQASDSVFWQKKTIQLADKDLGFGMSYCIPVFENAEILNDSISGHLNNETVFVLGIDDHITKNFKEDEIDDLLIGKSEVHSSTSKIISFAFIYGGTYPGASSSFVRTFTFNYSIEREKFHRLEDLYNVTDDFIHVIENRLYNDYRIIENSENLELTVESLQKFCISDTSLIFYFSPGEIPATLTNVLSVEIGKSELIQFENTYQQELFGID